jgi:hypothetical protein
MGIRESTKQEAWAGEKRAAELLVKLGAVDKAITEDFALVPKDVEFLDEEFGVLVSDLPTTDDTDRDRLSELYCSEKDELTRDAMKVVGARRFTAKKMFWASRRVELLSRIFSAHPAKIVGLVAEQELCNPADLAEMAISLVSWIAGVAFGRWDIRFATSEKPAQDLLDPFVPLPVCPPGMLQNEQGLPLTEDDVRRLQVAGQWNYPLDIQWDGILVDDPGPDNAQPHRDDIVRRVRTVVEAIWKDRAEAIEQEACEILVILG